MPIPMTPIGMPDFRDLAGRCRAFIVEITGDDTHEGRSCAVTSLFLAAALLAREGRLSDIAIAQILGIALAEVDHLHGRMT